jgi:DNA-binding NtrC family response regulator
MKQRVLIVDDDEAIRVAATEALMRSGREVRVADDATVALRMLDGWTPDVVLCDVRMPGMDGLQLLELLDERVPSADVLMMTAYDDMPTVIRAMRAGAVEFLVKPLDLHELRSTIDRLFADRATRAASSGALPDASVAGILVGRSPGMIRVFKQIGQAASVRSAVLIRGESGTGKEFVARAIHTHSDSGAQPFVPVNCAALPSTLLESELFGHTRGAFTGAVSDRRGRFALADRGTIFLDEIGDTSLDFQTRLLRVLQDREFQPVGSETILRTDARVISATHRALESMIDDGRFREDLYFRLRILEITLPPLRERAGDIPLLAAHLVQRISESLSLSALVISDDAMRVLAQHPWPGNVRELEHCLTRAAVDARSGVIRPEHLALAETRNGHEHGEPTGTLASVERDHLARVYESTGRNKSRTAEILGVSRPRLDRLMQKHGVT